MKLAQLLFCFALSIAGPAPASAQAPRAIWTWEPESYRMLQDPAAAAAGIAFLQSKSIGTIYLYADAYQGRNLIIEEPALYRSLVRRMHGAGIRVVALLGSWHLHTERYVLREHHHRALEMVQRVLDYNARALPGERFDGINLDIEPHLLPEWEAQKNALLGQFIDMGAAIMKLKRQSGQQLAIGPAIPFWWDGIAIEWHGRRKPASEHVQDLYDYVAVMDYRDHALGPDGMVRHAADELAYARRIGRDVVIGVETIPNEIRKVSFDHLSEAEMERELKLVEKEFAKVPAFRGFVIHHFSGYQRWLQRQRTN